MAEENKNTQQGENEPESGKTFTQEEVNKIVQQECQKECYQQMIFIQQDQPQKR